MIDHDQLLFDALAEEPALGAFTIKVPQRGGRNARKAREGWAKLQDRLHTYRMTRGVEI